MLHMCIIMGLLYRKSWFLFSFWGDGMAIPHAKPQYCFSIVRWCIPSWFNGSTARQIFQDIISVDAIHSLQTIEAPVTAMK